MSCSTGSGGDKPKAVSDALFDILNMMLQRVCVIISDAPPHGLKHGDNFPQCPAGHDPVCITSEMAKISDLSLYTR